MKKMLVAAVAAMVAFAAGNANAQCIGCQQNAQPVFGATQSYGTPVQSYSAPMQSYSAPMQSYSAPMQSYSAPMQSYSAPMQSYSAPMQSYSAPMQSYSAPMQTYAAPMQSYSSPCNCGGMSGTPIYSTPMQGFPAYGTVTSGMVVNGGVVEGSIVESPASTAMGEGSATPSMEMDDSNKSMEDGTEPPVPAVSSPEPEADAMDGT